MVSSNETVVIKNDVVTSLLKSTDTHLDLDLELYSYKL